MFLKNCLTTVTDDASKGAVTPLHDVWLRSSSWQYVGLFRDLAMHCLIGNGRFQSPRGVSKDVREAAQLPKSNRQKGQPHAGQGQHADSRTSSNVFYRKEVVVEQLPETRPYVLLVVPLISATNTWDIAISPRIRCY